MPVATSIPTTGLITRPEQLVETLADIIERSPLPFEYIAKYDESLLPKYPAVIIQPGQFEKELHGLATFIVSLRATIYVLHAKLTETKQRRSYNDLVLATQVIELLESNFSLGTWEDDDNNTHERVIFGYVESEIPAALPPRAEFSDAVVSTRLSWHGTNQVRFK